MMAALRCFLVAVALSFCGCEDRRDDTVIVFGTSADYRPLEFYEDGKLTGFEIELAKVIATKLGKEAKFEDMPFSSLLTGLENDTIDVVVSSLVPSEERRNVYDFTDLYCSSGIALIFKKGAAPSDLSTLKDVKIACQLGSIPEKWLKAHRPESKLVSIDNATQAPEFVKAGHVEGAVLDSIIAIEFCNTNPTLDYKVVDDHSDDGFAMAAKKGSHWIASINTVIRELEANGELHALREKWGLAK
jgi:polar amino acid transport system substrate-binding protein